MHGDKAETCRLNSSRLRHDLVVGHQDIDLLGQLGR